MTLYVTNLRLQGDTRLIAGFQYRPLEQQVGLVLTADAARAITVVTDRPDQADQRVRLVQTLIRRPRPDSPVLPFEEVVRVAELVTRRCEVVSRELPEAATEADRRLPNTTQAIGEAYYDLDAWGADCQLSRNDNRFVSLTGPVEARTLRVLSARLVVDAATGTRYPAITAVAGESGAAGDGATGDGAAGDEATANGATTNVATGDGAAGDGAAGNEAAGNGATGNEAAGDEATTNGATAAAGGETAGNVTATEAAHGSATAETAATPGEPGTAAVPEPGEPLFWSLPDQFADWLAAANAMNVLPATFVFSQAADGTALVALQGA
ncbi:hypothetical protein [Lacticaseibacillus parakribbianus]|uniref:hypothetical protein n=1 Tax=Lacticaseibacillus parakribbianus TaxID=2970927 RepID=UPI0021CB4792|nr:hypothetical protein [Lacticaseibacillus parakribbianus]